MTIPGKRFEQQPASRTYLWFPRLISSARLRGRRFIISMRRGCVARMRWNRPARATTDIGLMDRAPRNANAEGVRRLRRGAEFRQPQNSPHWVGTASVYDR
jgi:hypothetical protein